MHGVGQGQSVDAFLTACNQRLIPQDGVGERLEYALMLGIQALCKAALEILQSFSSCLVPALFSTPLFLKGSTTEQGRKWSLKCHRFTWPSSFYFSCRCPQGKNEIH